MIFKYLSKNKKILLSISIAILAVGIFVFLYSPVIFQEGNPWPQIKGIVQLNFTNKGIIKLSELENKYITKSENGQKTISDFLKNQGYKLLEQMGSGYLFESDNGDRLIASHSFYSRFYSIWKLSEIDNIRKSIEWVDYKNEEYGFMLRYPKVSVDNYLWGAALPEGVSISDVLLPNQILSKNNNFYLHEKYDVSINQKTGELIKTENTSVPEYNGPGYPVPWNIVILEVKNENDLDKIIKQKLGSGCSYKTRIPTAFNDNYRIEMNGDGKDLGSTACPVNYVNYIIYNPVQGKVAFWGTGQECQIGLDFINCFDAEISNSFHFYDEQKSLAEELKECLSKSGTASHEKCNELLKQIIDYDSCVNVGFSIMKSNPPQCATPDGRTFEKGY